MPIGEFDRVPVAFRDAHYSEISRWLHDPDWRDLHLVPHQLPRVMPYVAASEDQRAEALVNAHVAPVVTLKRTPFRGGTVMVQPADDASAQLMQDWVTEQRRHADGL